MILLSPDAVLDVERVRGFLEERNPEAARRTSCATRCYRKAGILVTRLWHGREARE